MNAEIRDMFILVESHIVLLHPHLQGPTSAFTWMEIAPRCVRANWASPTAPACRATPSQPMEEVARPPPPPVEQRVTCSIFRPAYPQSIIPRRKLRSKTDEWRIHRCRIRRRRFDVCRDQNTRDDARWSGARLGLGRRRPWADARRGPDGFG